MDDYTVPKRLFGHRWAHRLLPRPMNWGVIAAGFALRERPRSPARQSGGHRFSMHYVLSGRIRHLDASGRTHPLEPGDFFVFTPDQTHGPYPDASGDFLEAVLILDPDTARQCAGLGMTLDAPVGRPGLRSDLVEAFEHLLRRMEEPGPAWEDWPLPQALAWMDRLVRLSRARQTQVPNELLRRACQLLSADLDRKLSLPQVAEELGVTYEFFRKYFRAELNISPGQYRIRQRIQAACTMLGEGLRVRTVAEQLGYCDPFVFSQQFRQQMGLSPQQFRRLPVDR